MHTAHSLSPRLWNAILGRIEKANARTEFIFTRVVKSDDVKKLVWTREFCGTPIPLVSFKYGFSYYDTQSDGTVNKRDDLKGENEHVVTPKKGALVVIVKPYGNLEKPFCIGQVLSRDYWEEK